MSPELRTPETHSVDAADVMLQQMSGARRFNRWMADALLPWLQGDTLEFGAGIGNLTALLCTEQQRYVATDTDGQSLALLRRRLAYKTNLETRVCDAASAGDMQSLRRAFDCVVCLNVLEHIADDRAALSNMYSCLRPAGVALVLVPQGPFAFGSLDEVLSHQRRYTANDLQSKMIAAGFTLRALLPFNRVTLPGWFLNSRILRRRTLSQTQLELFERLVPVWRSIDRYLPWPANSLIAVGVRED